MMKIFFVFLLVSSSQQRLCIYRETFQFPTNPFDAVEFKKVLKLLQPITTQIQVCRVELTFDYNQQYLKVEFHPERRTYGSDRAEQPRFVTTFSLYPHPSTSESVLIYTCSKKEACDQDFVLALSSWQLNHNYSQLQIKLADLLDKKNARPALCITKSSEQKLEKCQTGICRIDVGARNNISSNYGCGCVSKGSASINVKITSISDYQTYVFQHNVVYQCMYSGCNNATIVNKVLNAILHLYDVSKMFNMENIENQTPISNQLLSTSTKEIMSLEVTTMSVQTFTSNHTDQTTMEQNNAALLKFAKILITIQIVLFVILS